MGFEVGVFDRIASSMTGGAFFALCLSCAVGTGISYAGWFCRQQTSATTFTLVGVMNKVATITVNALMWDNHASMQGFACLLLCIAGGALYQQAPLIKQIMKPDEKGEEEDKQRLMGANASAETEMYSLEKSLEEGGSHKAV